MHVQTVWMHGYQDWHAAEDVMRLNILTDEGSTGHSGMHRSWTHWTLGLVLFFLLSIVLIQLLAAKPNKPVIISIAVNPLQPEVAVWRTSLEQTAANRLLHDDWRHSVASPSLPAACCGVSVACSYQQKMCRVNQPSSSYSLVIPITEKMKNYQLQLLVHNHNMFRSKVKMYSFLLYKLLTEISNFL